mgnify:CR=1 FL=1
MVAIVGLGSWLYLSGDPQPTTSQEQNEAATPEMLDGDFSQTVSPTIQNPPSVEEMPVPVVAAPAVETETVIVPSDLEKEINEVLANAHAVHDNFERADALIEAKLDIQIRAALERRAITPREAPEYRDYLRQIAIEESAREEEEYEPDGPAVSGLFADRSFVTEE